MKLLAMALISCGLLAAQTKTCTQFDIEAGHRIPVPCAPKTPSKVKAAAAKVHHKLKAAGEAALVATIVGAFIYAKGVK